QAVLVETSVSKQHVNVKIRDDICRIRNGRKAEPGCLIAGIEVVVQVIHSGQSLVDVLGREVDAVIVIPERGHRFGYVSVWRVGRSETGQDVGIVLVIKEGIGKLRVGKEVAWETIAL